MDQSEKDRVERFIGVRQLLSRKEGLRIEPTNLR